jgi:sarcosine oxidase, subunit gamma
MLNEWMRTLPPSSRFIFHGDALARTAAVRAWGVGFAETPCRAIVQGERATLWLGPDEYLLWRSGRDGHAESALAIEQALLDIPHALVDVSHRQIALEISGPYAERILNAGCPLDLDVGQFPVGMCTRTVFAKADIVLWRTALQVFHVEVWRSFEGYVRGLLHEIGREFSGGTPLV